MDQLDGLLEILAEAERQNHSFARLGENVHPNGFDPTEGTCYFCEFLEPTLSEAIWDRFEQESIDEELTEFVFKEENPSIMDW